MSQGQEVTGNAPTSRQKAGVRLGVLALFLMVLFSVFLWQFRQRAGAAFGIVMQDIGELKPFTHAAPAGSVVMLNSDTVAVIDRVTSVGDSARGQALYRGHWLEHTAVGVRSDTLLEAYRSLTREPYGPVVIDLVRGAAPRGPSNGRLLLEPGGHIIVVRSRSR